MKRKFSIQIGSSNIENEFEGLIPTHSRRYHWEVAWQLHRDTIANVCAITCCVTIWCDNVQSETIQYSENSCIRCIILVTIIGVELYKNKLRKNSKILRPNTNSVIWKMADCSYARCVQERRFIKRELQKWTKDMVHIVGKFRHFFLFFFSIFLFSICCQLCCGLYGFDGEHWIQFRAIGRSVRKREGQQNTRKITENTFPNEFLRWAHFIHLFVGVVVAISRVHPVSVPTYCWMRRK